MRNRHPVIRHGHSLLFGPLNPGHDIFPVEHTGSALNNQIITGQIPGIIGSAYKVNRNAGAYPFAKHARYLFSPDILRKRRMGTALRNQNLRLFGQIV